MAELKGSPPTDRTAELRDGLRLTNALSWAAVRAEMGAIVMSRPVSGETKTGRGCRPLSGSNAPARGSATKGRAAAKGTAVDGDGPNTEPNGDSPMTGPAASGSSSGRVARIGLGSPSSGSSGRPASNRLSCSCASCSFRLSSAT